MMNSRIGKRKFFEPFSVLSTSPRDTNFVVLIEKILLPQTLKTKEVEIDVRTIGQRTGNGL